jgi:hypothetical protein
MGAASGSSGHLARLHRAVQDTADPDAAPRSAVLPRGPMPSSFASAVENDVGAEMTRRTGGLSTAILMAVVMLSACTSSTDGSSSGPTSPVSTASLSTGSNLGEISYCVGTSARHKSGQTVVVKFMRGSQVLGEPSITVPMRTSVQVSPGPYSVVVDGKVYMRGSISAGETATGSDGGNCPST